MTIENLAPAWAAADREQAPSLARRLIAHGIPVVVLKPAKGWQAGDPSDLLTPKGWNRITAAKAAEDLDLFRPGIDALAMVAGHGLDVIDIDAKDGGDISMLPEGLDILGIHRTPSGGWHVFIRSTGIAKISPLYDRATGAKVGDYCGGTASGRGRMLAYLPGSWRPKYDGADYTVEQPIQFDRLNGPADPVALSWLIENGGSTGGEQAAEADASAAAAWYRGLPPVPEITCTYGQRALAGILGDAPAEAGGRHGWAVRAFTRAVELARAGCIGRDGIDAISAKLAEIKPEGGSSADGIMAWAVANASGTVACDVHVRGMAPALLDVPPVSVDGLRETFRKWLGADFDTDVVTAVAACAVTQMKYSGDPAWLLVVAGSGSAKTETVQTLAGVGAFVEGGINSPGALLSGTSAKDVTADATGGLLPKIGSDGILVLKDVTTILSMQREARAQVLAGLREVYDGNWTRNLGSDGGKTVEWSGRITVVGAVTTAWDEHHAVTASMGDRFLLARLRTDDRKADGLQALANLGSESEMRAELRAAMAGAVMHADSRVPLMPRDVQVTLVRCADLVARVRSQLVANWKGEVSWAHEPEAPTRLVKQLAQVWRGARALGLHEAEAIRLTLRIAFDTMPFDRSKFIAYLLDHPGANASDMSRDLAVSYNGARAAMECLMALGFVRREDALAAPASYSSIFMAEAHEPRRHDFVMALTDDEIEVLRAMRDAARKGGK